MSRIINTEGTGKERTRLTRCVVLALRELMRQTEADDKSKDLAAFVALTLEDLYAVAEASVAAWEKKGYWVKADRFRMEWDWARVLGEKMRTAVLKDDWATVALISAQVAQKMMTVDVPVRHKLGTPWVGAYARLKSE